MLSKLLGSEPGLRRELVRGGLGSLGVKAMYLPLQFLVSVLLARMLGPSGLGVYAFVLALVGLLVIPGQLGFPGLLLRRVAVYKEAGDLPRLKALLARALQSVLFASVVVAGLVALVVSIFEVGQWEIPETAVALGAVLIPLLALLGAVAHAVRGLGRVVWGQLPPEVIRPLGILIAILAVDSWAGLSPNAAIMANIVATAAALAVAWYLLLRLQPQGLMSVVPRAEPGAWSREAMAFTLLAGAQLINHQADLLMLGTLAGSSATGLYRVAAQTADGLGVILLALSAAITPHLARLYAIRDWSRIRRILVYGHRAGALLLLPMALGLALFGAPFLDLVFGSDYTPAAASLAILVVGKAAYATVGFSGIALSMFGMAGVASMVTALSAVLNIGLNLVLIPSFGPAGAAMANATSMFSVSVGALLWMRRRFGIDFSIIGLHPPGRDRDP